MSNAAPQSLVTLVRAAQEGDGNSFEAFAAAVRPALKELAHYVIPRSISRRYPDSDATQDVLVKVVEKIGTFDGTTDEAVWAWLTTILHCLVIDAVRSMLAAKRDCRREVALDADPAVDVADVHTARPDQAAEQAEVRRTFVLAVAHLPREAQLLLDCWMRETPVAKIAEQYGVSCDAIYKRIERVYVMLLAYINAKTGNHAEIPPQTTPGLSRQRLAARHPSVPR